MRTDSTKILFLYLCVSKSVCLHVLMCACVLVCVCMLVQVYIPIHTQKRLEKGVSCLPISFSIYFFEAGFFSEAKTHFLSFAATPVTFLSLFTLELESWTHGGYLVYYVSICCLWFYSKLFLLLYRLLSHPIYPTHWTLKLHFFSLVLSSLSQLL